MSIKRDIQSTLEEAERDLDSPVFNWLNKNIPAIPSYETTTTLIDPAGNPVNTDLALLVRRQHFITADITELTADSDLVLADDYTPAPKSGDLITFDARPYRVLIREWCPAKAFIRFRCADPHSGQ